MTDEQKSDPIMTMMAYLSHADGVAEAGVLAICARLITKGAFDGSDVAYVIRYMREALSTDRDDPFAENAKARLDKSEAQLRDLWNDQKLIGGRNPDKT